MRRNKGKTELRFFCSAASQYLRRVRIPSDPILRHEKAKSGVVSNVFCPYVFLASNMERLAG
jgi:hypothetical protein